MQDFLRGKVYPVFLNIENPKTFDAKGKDGWAGWHELKQDVGYDLSLEHNGFVYVFNTFRAVYKENTTHNPIGDGFEILHKIRLSTISPAERELLNRYNSDRNSEDINKVLSIPEDESTGSNMGSPDSVKSRTEDGNDRLDASEHKEQSRAARGNNSGRRDSNEARILETPEGIIYGFVKDGVIYLEPSLGQYISAAQPCSLGER